MPYADLPLVRLLTGWCWWRACVLLCPGAGTLDTVKIGDLGADITTDTGEIYLKNVDGVCNPLYV